MVTKEFIQLADFVRTQRKRQALTQAELAETVGVGVRFVHDLEAAKPTLRMDKVNQVLWLFGYELTPVPSKEVAQSEDDGAS